MLSSRSRVAGSRAPYNFSQAAVKEFQVVNSNFSAEFGKAAGAVVNVITKSGSNDLHGEGFYFLRDSGVAARNPFAATLNKSRQQQFGGSVGSPIRKDKVFSFGNYDQQMFPGAHECAPSKECPAPSSTAQTRPSGMPPSFCEGFEGDFKSELLANVFSVKTDWIIEFTAQFLGSV